MNARTTLIPLLLCLALAAPLAHAQDGAGWGFDAVLDSRSAHRDGLPVLAVTPGGSAERMGIAVGDRVLAINGRVLTGVDAPARTLDDALHASNGRAQVLILRNGSRITLQGALSRSPAAATLAGCGYVSDTDPTPRTTEGIYTGEVTQVDGRSTPLGDTNRLRMKAGPHVLVVQEFIPGQWLNSGQRRARRLMQKRLQAKAYKALLVDVQPNTRYSVGVRLLRDKLDATSIRDNAYWEPVVFATRGEACR